MAGKYLSIVLLTATLVLAGCGVQNPPSNDVVNNSVDNSINNKTNNEVSGGLRVCPEQMIVSRMPGFDSSGGTSYYILNGVRRERAEFDIDWLTANCKVPVMEVQ